MSTLILSMHASDVDSYLEHYAPLTGVVFRASATEKRVYLDSHVFANNGGAQKQPVGSKLETLIRVMIRWTVMSNPHLSSSPEVLGMVKKVLCQSSSRLCSPEDYDNFINLGYGGGRKGFVFRNDVMKQVMTVYEEVFLHQFVEMRNPSQRWLGQFIINGKCMAELNPDVYRQAHYDEIEEIQTSLTYTKDQWTSRKLHNSTRGLLWLLVSNCQDGNVLLDQR